MALAAAAAGLSPVLNGCAGGLDSGQRYAQAGTSDAHRWSEGASGDELGRFNTVFTTYASDPGATRQLKHFRDAFKRIRAAYVDEIPEQRLIDSAIEGSAPKIRPPAQ
ncbi:MAG: hypothetical protein IPK78_14235 [Rhodospirillales bacterium]|nr:hypothetical protein [Rhodospirillales bacterium]